MQLASSLICITRHKREIFVTVQEDGLNEIKSQSLKCSFDSNYNFQGTMLGCVTKCLIRSF